MSLEWVLQTCLRCLEVVLPTHSPASGQHRFQAKVLPGCLPVLPHPCTCMAMAEQGVWMEPFPLN